MTNYNDYTLVELRNKLRELNLQVSGNKPILIDRLNNYDSGIINKKKESDEIIIMINKNGDRCRENSYGGRARVCTYRDPNTKEFSCNKFIRSGTDYCASHKDGAEK